MDAFLEELGDSPVVWAILGAEVAFWLLLVGGLVVRYLLRWRRVSTALLLAVPVVDLVLVALVAIDLSTGTEPTLAHRLAAVYLGVTVAFGHRIISRTDAWFAWRFAGAPKPAPAPRQGMAAVRHQWQDWFRALAFGLITVTGLLLMQWVSGWQTPHSWSDLEHLPLWGWSSRIAMVVGIWLLVGPLYTSVFRSGESQQVVARR